MINRERSEKTVPIIYMNGTDADALPVELRPTYGEYTTSDIPVVPLNCNSDEDWYGGDERPEYQL